MEIKVDETYTVYVVDNQETGKYDFFISDDGGDIKVYTHSFDKVNPFSKEEISIEEVAKNVMAYVKLMILELKCVKAEDY